MYNRYPAQGMGDLTSALQSVAGGASSLVRGAGVRRVILRSNLSPDLDLTPYEAAGPSGMIPGTPGGAGGPDGGGAGRTGGVAPGQGVKRRGGINEALLAFAKPEIELDTAVGRIRVAPWGAPTTNLFWPLVILGGAGLGALTILAIRGLRA